MFKCQFSNGIADKMLIVEIKSSVSSEYNWMIA